MAQKSIENQHFISVDSAQKVDTAVWNSLVNDRFYLQLDYLYALERTVTDIKDFIYTIYYQNDEPFGISIFQKMELDLSTYQYKDVQWKISKDLLRRFVKKKVGILMCGNIFATGENIFSFRKDISSVEIFNQLNSCIEETLKCHDHLSYVVFKEFNDASEVSKLLMENYHYHKLNINDLMSVSIDEDVIDINDYCQKFTAKYRTRSNKVFKKSQELVCKEFDLAQIEKNAEILERLYLSVVEKSSFNIGIFHYNTFLKLKEKLGNKYRFFVYYHDDKIVGFKTCFHFNNVIDANFIGIDYEVNNQFDTYQRMLLDYLKFAIDQKAEKLYLGRTAETIKSCIGAEPQAMNLFIKHRNLIGCFILNVLIKFIKPLDKEIRKPFKKEYYK